MSPEDLGNLAFPSPKEPARSPPPASYNTVSSASSACHESDTEIPSEVNVLSPPLGRQHSEQLNAKVSQRKTSRQGRFGQRYVTEDNEQIRLTTGCVPILKDGKIMLISASRQPEWILPKGGWEIDEPIEESAIRECFEEAGVVGTLGPKLSAIQYETRKAKRRRLEEKRRLDSDSTVASDDADDLSVPVTASVSLPDGGIKKLQERPHQDETASCNSTFSSSYSQVRLTLFPLYVTKVEREWPEAGRLRKAVSIDEAIRLTASRPEFQKAIIELKERNLHIK